jgi:hypothetical protein
MFAESLQGPHEKRLLHTLLDHYNVLERPVANESDPLQLSFGLTLMQIIDVVSVVLHSIYFCDYVSKPCHYMATKVLV